MSLRKLKVIEISFDEGFVKKEQIVVESAIIPLAVDL